MLRQYRLAAKHVAMRVLTSLHLALPWVRSRWRLVFSTSPELFNARHYANVHRPLVADEIELVDEYGYEALQRQRREQARDIGYATFAGYYNDRTPFGHMSLNQARRLFRD